MLRFTPVEQRIRRHFESDSSAARAVLPYPGADEFDTDMALLGAAAVGVGGSDICGRGLFQQSDPEGVPALLAIVLCFLVALCAFGCGRLSVSRPAPVVTTQSYFGPERSIEATASSSSVSSSGSRSVMTQSQATYRRKLATPRFVPLDEGDQDTWR